MPILILGYYGNKVTIHQDYVICCSWSTQVSVSYHGDQGFSRSRLKEDIMSSRSRQRSDV